jgi:predicted RNA binding protein YcfA (HicA-like mRNA interferase family)
MARRAPRVTGTVVVRAMRRAGWEQVRQTGSHAQLRHPARAGLVTVPIHRGEILSPKLLASILQQAGLSVDEFVDLL